MPLAKRDTQLGLVHVTVQGGLGVRMWSSRNQSGPFYLVAQPYPRALVTSADKYGTEPVGFKSIF